MNDVTIYHNPKCSKSRQTLSLLQEKGINPTIIEYLKTPPSLDDLNALLKKLRLSPLGLMRKKEALFKSLHLADATDAVLLSAMKEHPTLIERPIVVKGDKAVLGRPPENIHTLW